MPSTESVNLASIEKRNLPHIVSDLNLLEPQAVLNGLFRFVHKKQAHNMPVSHKYHQVQPITTVSASAFSQGNYFFDLNIPMNIDLLDDLILEFTLYNSDSSNSWVASASVPWWFQRIELRQDNHIIQTIKDIHLYLANTIYLDDFERYKNQPNIAMTYNTYQVNTTAGTVGKGSSSTYRLKLGTLLEKNKVFIKAIRGQLVIRVYPQSLSVISSTTVNSLQLQNPMLLLRELELSPDGRNKMVEVHRKNVDYRYLDVIDETPTVSLTSGATTKYITNNFHNQVYSHVVVLTRSANPTLSNLETFNQQNNIYFQDASGNNLSNGIQWTDADLRLAVYQDHFPNAMTQQTNM